MRLFLLGATGKSGRRILRFALERGHQVTAFVRDQSKLSEIFGPSLAQSLQAITGKIDKSAELAGAMIGHDVVINAAGYVTEGAIFTGLMRTVIDAASTARRCHDSSKKWRCIFLHPPRWRRGRVGRCLDRSEPGRSGRTPPVRQPPPLRAARTASARTPQEPQSPRNPSRPGEDSGARERRAKCLPDLPPAKQRPARSVPRTAPTRPASSLGLILRPRAG